MPKFISISMLGAPELQKKLRALPITTQKKVVRKATRDAAKAIARPAKAKAPRGSTGRLKQNIRVRAMKRSRRRVGHIISTGTRQQMGIAADPKKYYYPAGQELGNVKTRERRFLKDALAQEQDRVMSQLKRDIAAGIEREAGK